jgi:galactose mutarotase-like enzyme
MILLNSASTNTAINPEGAWVETLTAGGQTLLFPKSDLITKAGETKTRGGMHVCLPNFGPGGESGLAQHGFGRTSTWSVIQRDESSVLLELAATNEYAGLVAKLEYRAERDSLVARLSLTSRGSVPLRVAPGFHPYFALEPSETAVTVNKEVFKLNEIAGTEYRDADSAELLTAKRRITLTTENLSTWAIWTDQLGNYACVEPTFGGNRFLEPDQPDEQLAPGETKTYSVHLKW